MYRYIRGNSFSIGIAVITRFFWLFIAFLPFAALFCESLVEPLLRLFRDPLFSVADHSADLILERALDRRGRLIGPPR